MPEIPPPINREQARANLFLQIKNHYVAKEKATPGERRSVAYGAFTDFLRHKGNELAVKSQQPDIPPGGDKDEYDITITPRRLRAEIELGVSREEIAEKKSWIRGYSEAYKEAEDYYLTVSGFYIDDSSRARAMLSLLTEEIEKESQAPS